MIFFHRIKYIFAIVLLVFPFFPQVALGGGGSPDATWVVTDGFDIFQSSSLTWDADGPAVCTATLTDGDADTVTCSAGTISNNTTYRVQVILKNAGTAEIAAKGPNVGHRNVQSWAGTGATLTSCGFNDFGADDGAVTCTVAFADADADTSSDDVTMTSGGTGNVKLVIAASGGQEGFMYLITTGTVASDNTNFFDNTFNAEQSSKIDITAAAPPPVADPTSLEQVAYRWFANNDSTNVGRAGGFNTPVIAPPEGTPIRLRLLLHVDGSDLASSGTTSKMQLGEKPAGGCASATFSDIGGSTDITWFDNATPADGAALTSKYQDPRHAATTSSHAVINQTYNESNNFTNSQGVVDAGADMLFDFALSVSTTSTDISAKGGKTYCFRGVQAGGESFAQEGGGGYTVYPELSIEKPTKLRLRGAIRLRVVRLR